MMILKVAVAAPVYSIFDYLPPVDCAPGRLISGIRLRVPFGRGERCGVLLQVTTDSQLQASRLKRVREVLDEQALFGAEDIALLRWAADYYHYPLGEVIAGALPARLRKCAKEQKGGLSGWRLTALGSAVDPAALRRAPRQAEVMRLLMRSPAGLSPQDITLYCGACAQVLRNLERRGWLEQFEFQSVNRAHVAPSSATAPDLNADQRLAVDRILASLSGFASYLLDGVTGSGKTEVYLELVKKVVALGGQVLVLTPEIGLTPQLLQRFQSRLQISIAVMHSGLAEGEREQVWRRARLAHARVLIGTRSAVFVPMPELRLILVDEEHDLSFKQQDGFRYSARDVAVVRARRCNCPVVLGSATPSLESLKNALDGRYLHLRLPQRAGGAAPPRIELLDIRSTHLEAGMSPVLTRLLEVELSAGNQVLLFLNRRGYAPILTCHDCGWLAQCERCDARMTLHLSDNLLSCHHCGGQRRVDRYCPECGGKELRALGQGTERLEETLRARFPGVGLVRIDRDATRRRGTLEKLLGEIKEGKHSLLLGTQMLAKGHHFPDVTLVGIVDLDQALFGADFRAGERMAQLIVQVAGRAGRAEKPGRVIIQTRHPEHPLMQTLLCSGYAAFASESLRERQLALLPPYCFQALLRAEAQHRAPALVFLQQCVELGVSLKVTDVELWGPVSAPMERRAGRYRFQLLLQSDRRSALQEFLAEWIPRIAALKSARRVRWSVDVDPQEML